MSFGTAPQCYSCRHLILPLVSGAGWRCAAFARIPKEILVNKVDHRTPVDGDNGIQFETREAVRAAGVILLAGGKALMLRRGPGAGDHSGEWAFPGGHIEDGETAEEAALRELEEETGFEYGGPLRLWIRGIEGGVDFTTFLGRVDVEFVPKLNGEHDNWAWIDVKELLAGEGRADSAPAQPPRLDRSALGYVRPRVEHDAEQCATCRDYMPGLRKCAILDVEADPEDSCAYYIVGVPSDEQNAVQRVTPEEAGFVKGPVRCENCAAGGERCQVYVGLNQRWPELFALDEVIEPKACCNCWHPRSEARQGAAQYPVSLTLEMTQWENLGKLLDFLRYVRNTAGGGHSFSLEADREEGDWPSKQDGWPKVFVDGDGADKIGRILLNGRDVTKPERADAASFRDDEVGFEESKHPRDADGKFAKGATAAKTAIVRFSHHDFEIVHKYFGARDSDDRRKIADHVRSAAKALPELVKSHVKEELQNTKHASGALLALSTGKKPTKEQLGGLKNLGIRVALSAISMSVTGEPTGVVSRAAASFVTEVVQHVIAEHSAKFLAGAGRVLHGHMRSRKDSDDDLELELLQDFLEDLAEALEGAEIEDSGEERADKVGFEESEHPRDKDGQFASKGGGAFSRLALAPDRSKWPKHIQELKLPPAWTDVRISADPKAALQAVGRDSKGRPQYVYSAKFRASQTAKKFARIKKLEAKLDQVTRQNDRALRSRDSVIREHAAATALVLKMGLRPGSERDTGAAEQAFGATTLRSEHVVKVNNQTWLSFVGKKGVKIRLPVEDPAVAKDLRERAARGGQLFPEVTTSSLRRYVGSLDGGGFKTKDLRTLKATKLASELVKHGPMPTSMAAYKKRVREVAVAVAEELGNTPTVALQSYISPVVFAKWRQAIEEKQ